MSKYQQNFRWTCKIWIIKILTSMPISLVSVLVLPVPPRTVKVGSVLLHVTILIVINQSKVSMLLVQSTIRIRTKAQDVKCQCKISNVEWEMCNVKYQVWNVKCQITIDKSQITKDKRQQSTVKWQMSNQNVNVKAIDLVGS